ncbi:O-antigen ligase family protein [Tessaracoccus sp. G1721]
MPSLMKSTGGLVVEHEVVDEGASSWLARVYPLDALLFSLFIFDRVSVGPIPAGVLITILIGVVGFLRPPTLRMRGLPVLAVGYAGLLVYLVIVSQDAGVDWQQRVLRMFILGILIWVLVQGRFDAFSAIAGLVLGLGINAAAYYAGLTTDNYPPFLTGWLGDKNVAGMWYATVGVLGLMLLSRHRWTIPWLVVSGGFLFLTGSRTSMSALLVGLVWFWARNRLAMPLRLALAGGLIAALAFAEQNFARMGLFADRAGTDLLRGRIEAATALKVEQTPWYGRGLTEAWVNLGQTELFWFHNSYAALYVEGGVVLLTFALVVWGVVAGGLFSTEKMTRETRAAEAALVVLLVCAWQLGEVFFTSCAFIVLGLALRSRFSQPQALRD